MQYNNVRYISNTYYILNWIAFIFCLGIKKYFETNIAKKCLNCE